MIALSRFYIYGGAVPLGSWGLHGGRKWLYANYPVEPILRLTSFCSVLSSVCLDQPVIYYCALKLKYSCDIVSL